MEIAFVVANLLWQTCLWCELLLPPIALKHIQCPCMQRTRPLTEVFVGHVVAQPRQDPSGPRAQGHLSGLQELKPSGGCGLSVSLGQRPTW